MKSIEFWVYLLILAGSTYLIRAIPFAAVRKKIDNRRIRSFLSYIPYAVLTAMTLPAVLYETASIWSALVGFLTAVWFAYKGKGLTTVAIVSCVAVFVTELFVI